MTDQSTTGRATAADAIVTDLLRRFPQYLANAWVQLSGEKGYFGDGSNGENGIRTNANVIFTAALLATRENEFQLDDENRSLLLLRAKHLLSYLVGSHVTGKGVCANGRKWGLEWQSAWWAAKAALGARLIWADLDDGERHGVRDLVVAEADAQLGRIAPTGLHLDTKAEENAWDCEILACAVSLFPDHPQREAWETKLVEFSANVFSSPHDRVSDGALDGRRIRDLVYTCNVHGDYSLENHGSFHFCYVASPMISKAWCAYALSSAGRHIPEAIYHNLSNVWAIAEKTYLGSRFAYIGGQDWARYTYGEYFIIPALVFLSRSFSGERELEILGSRLRILAKEALENVDGSFFGTRFTGGNFHGQHAKYETDCFCSLALAWSLHRSDKLECIAESPAASKPEDHVHVSPEGQFCFARGQDYFFSFCWTTLGQDVPNISFVSLKDDSLAEWHSGNLIGNVRTLGQSALIGVRAMKFERDAILIQGTCLSRDRRGTPLIEIFLKVKFDTVACVLSVQTKYVARSRLPLVRSTGLTWRVPNDLFNGYKRTIAHEHGVSVVEQAFQRRKSHLLLFLDKISRRLGFDASWVEPLRSRWINVDNLIGLIVGNNGSIHMRRHRERTSNWKSLFVDQFEAPKRRYFILAAPGTTLLETNVLLHLGNADRTSSIAADFK